MFKLLTFVAVAVLSSSSIAQVHCRFDAGHETCGPRLGGAHHVNGHHRHELVFETTHAPPNAHGILAFGLERTSLHIPGTRCLILVKPLILIAYASDAHGHARRSFEVGDPTGHVLAQSAFGVHGHVTTSNSLAVVCR